MKSFTLRATLRATLHPAALVVSASMAHAHPGHDGHDFSWDFRHLADHPGATILCLGMLGAAAWLVWKVISARTELPKVVPIRPADVRRKR